MHYLTFTNAGALPLCKNFILSLLKVGIDAKRILICCVDDGSYEELKDYPGAYRDYVSEDSEFIEYDPQEGSRYVSLLHNKWRIIRDQHAVHKHLCYCDSDIVFIENIENLGLTDKKILVLSDSPGSTLCAGFIIFNDSDASEEIIKICAKNKIREDQFYFNDVALRLYREDIAILNPDFFPSLSCLFYL